MFITFHICYNNLLLILVLFSYSFNLIYTYHKLHLYILKLNYNLNNLNVLFLKLYLYKKDNSLNLNNNPISILNIYHSFFLKTISVYNNRILFILFLNTLICNSDKMDFEFIILPISSLYIFDIQIYLH